jgi:hypothetical protein
MRNPALRRKTGEIKRDEFRPAEPVADRDAMLVIGITTHVGADIDLSNV